MIAQPASPAFTQQSLEFLSSFHALPSQGGVRVPIVDCPQGSSIFRIRSELLTSENTPLFRECVQSAIAEAASVCPVGSKGLVPHSEGLWTAHRNLRDEVLLEGHHRQFVELRSAYLHMGYVTHSPVKLCATMVVGLDGTPSALKPNYVFRFPLDDFMKGLLDYLAPQRPRTSRWRWQGEIRDDRQEAYRVEVERSDSAYEAKIRPVSMVRTDLGTPLINYWNAIEKAVLGASGIILQ